MKNAIEEAVALATRIPSAETEIEQLSKQLALVSAKVENASVLFSNLLGIEAVSKQKIETNLATLKGEQSQLENRIIQLKKRATLGSRYLQLSIEPLKWRDKNGWPRLATFSLESPLFKISASASIKGEYKDDRDAAYDLRSYRGENRRTPKIDFRPEVSPWLTSLISSCYADVFEKFRQDLTRDTSRDKEISIELCCRFEGLIPDDVKRKIVEARGLGLFKEIFIVAEPTNGFQINRTAVVAPKQDPLVVGFDGNQLWLIAEFDTTPVEEAMIFSLPDTKEGGVK